MTRSSSEPVACLWSLELLMLIFHRLYDHKNVTNDSSLLLAHSFRSRGTDDDDEDEFTFQKVFSFILKVDIVF